MLFILAIVEALVLLFLFHKQLKSHPGIFYALAFCILLFLAVYSLNNWYQVMPTWTYTYVISVFRRGAFSTALFTIIMYIGALDKKNFLVKKLMPIRAEMSIFACILTLGHNLVYGYYYFPILFTNPNSLEWSRLIATFITIILLALMIPLMITSFAGVRRKMKFKTWKKIQKSAYLFYFLIYIHVMVLLVPYANERGPIDIIVYSIVFISYFVLRISKYVNDKKIRRTNIVNN